MEAAVAELVSLELIENRILLLRGMKVMLDSDLAALYEVPTKVLNQAVKRNRGRFPPDFMFQLSEEEAEAVAEWRAGGLRSQFVTSKTEESRGGRRYHPYAFTEQGVAMLSSVLKSERAIAVNIAIMRAFVRLRHILATNSDLAFRFEELERRVELNSADIALVSQVISRLLEPEERPSRAPTGFPVAAAR